MAVLGKVMVEAIYHWHDLQMDWVSIRRIYVHLHVISGVFPF